MWPGPTLLLPARCWPRPAPAGWPLAVAGRRWPDSLPGPEPRPGLAGKPGGPLSGHIGPGRPAGPAAALRANGQRNTWRLWAGEGRYGGRGWANRKRSTRPGDETNLDRAGRRSRTTSTHLHGGWLRRGRWRAAGWNKRLRRRRMAASSPLWAAAHGYGQGGIQRTVMVITWSYRYQHSQCVKQAMLMKWLIVAACSVAKRAEC